MISRPALITVSQLNTYLRSLFDGDAVLSHVFLTGEISNFTDHYRSGHLYFSLKDDKSVIRAVMFSRYAQRLRFLPQDGMRVIARGHVSVYEATGQYQLYIEDMQPDGAGALAIAFEQLKQRLEKEGLFAAERKKPIPRFPNTIAVVTSPTGAAVHDIFTILERRWPLAQIVFFPVQVQGDSAAGQIAGAIRRLNRMECADVAIVGRGGGSLEDLWPFNEEIVARAVADSRIPIISAVGHETDFTICDFAADLRAPTPSAAAELAVPDRAELLFQIKTDSLRMQRAVLAGLERSGQILRPLAESVAPEKIRQKLGRREEELDRVYDRLTSAAESGIQRRNAELSRAAARLHALSPLAVLARGYAVVEKSTGHMVRAAGDLRCGDQISVRLQDGEAGCIVNTLKPFEKPLLKEEDCHESESDV